MKSVFAAAKYSLATMISVLATVISVLTTMKLVLITVKSVFDYYEICFATYSEN